MTLIIELPPEAEAGLAEKAKSAGMDLRTFAGKVLETEALRPASRKHSDWPPGYSENTYGCLSDDPLAVPEDPAPKPEAVE